MARSRTKRKELFFTVLLGLLLTGAALFLGELVFRTALWWRSGRFPTQTTEDYTPWGWRARPNFHFEGEVADACGRGYPLELHTDARGFRLWGDVQSCREKWWFLGDSFTHAIEVSDAEIFPRLVGDCLGVEVFAYGTRGHGTLQEWMVLRHYLDSIRPDAVVLQLHFNDFFNNDWELERNSYFNNNRRRRPYLDENGAVVFRDPAVLQLHPLDRWFRSLDFLLGKVEFYLSGRRHTRHTAAEDAIQRLGQDYPPFRRSIATTQHLLQRIRDELPPSTRLFLFIADAEPPYSTAFRRICTESGLPCIFGIPPALKAAEQAGQCTLASDHGHWNALGHRIAARVLCDSLHALLPSKP